MKRTALNLTFVLLLLLFGCNEKANVNIDQLANEGLVLTRWQILGPFSSDKANEISFDKDDLLQFGYCEKDVTYDEFCSIKSIAIKNKSYKSDSYKIDFNKLYGYTNEKSIAANVYCACLIKSSKDRNLKLNFSSDDGSKIWLNHKLIHNYNRICGLRYYENYIDINLKKGDNLLVVKINNIGFNWEMFAAIEEGSTKGNLKHQIAFSLEYGRNFLKRSVIDNDSLQLNIDLPSEAGVFSLYDQTKKIMFSNSIKEVNAYLKNISILKKGLYVSTLYVRNQTFTEKLFVGDIVAEIKQLLQSINNYRLNEDTKRNVEALTFRYNHLLKPGNMGKDIYEKREWDKKMIFLYTSINRYYNNLNKKNDPETGETGGLLKTYLSKIDNGVQYYQLFIPKNYSHRQSLPLVIELPKFMTRHESPLETYRFANIHLFELFEDVANKYNMIILDPGCRTIDKANNNAIDEADLWECLDDVKKHYHIDTTRIYLRGACLSSRSAMKLATKYPDKFAALSIIAPVTRLSTNKNIWMQQNEPMNYLKNITNMPISDIHVVVDSHSPIEGSEELMREAHKAGLNNFSYTKIPIELKTYYSEEYLEDIFRFFCKYSINYKPQEIFYSTSQLKYNKSFWITLNIIKPACNANIHAKIKKNILTLATKNIFSYTVHLTNLPYDKTKPLIIINNKKEVYRSIPHMGSITIRQFSRKKCGSVKKRDVEGPFAHIFSKPFIVVQGTIGNESENNRIQAVVDTIEKYWKLRYYSSCRLKLDKDISSTDLKGYSLLLIGSPRTNLVFKKSAKTLPIQIDNRCIIIGKNKVNGSNLSFYTIFPSPYNSKNYIGIIGSNNLSNLTLGIGIEESTDQNSSNDISNYGWFDYKIWNSHTLKILNYGYFDYYWK